MAKRKKKVEEDPALYQARLEAVLSAQERLLPYCRLMMPSIEFPNDARKTRFETMPHHEIIAEHLEAVERGDILRLIITMPPRHGKSQITSKDFAPWFVGKNPYRQTISATYNQEFAEDFGRHIKSMMNTPTYRQIFPGAVLDKGSQSASRLKTTEGGIMTFVGRGGSITGRGADLALVDDPIKDSEEADSPTLRDKLWTWYTRVLQTRLMPGGRIVIIMTRWHEDDLVGRLTDPENELYNPREAKKWTILNLPALMDHPETGEKECIPLWPQRYGKDYLLGIKDLDARGFYALYQQKPAPLDGDFFRRHHVVTYGPNDMPEYVRKYIASDHAVSTAQNRDATCMGIGCLDNDDVLWIHPELYWDRKETDDVVEAMLDMMTRHRPLWWWAERGHISKSIGPFLRKRQMEEQVYINLEEVTPVKDKMQRAQAIQARMAMGKVRFPRFAPWWPEAMNELMKFPYGKHDDFVDFMSLLGQGLDRQVRPGSPKPKKKATVHPIGSIGWVKEAAEQEANERRRIRLVGGI